MRVFLDANILFSASLRKSRTHLFLTHLEKHALLLTNLYAAEEARRNLNDKKSGELPALEKLLSQCEIVGAIAAVTLELALKDKPILGGAIAGNATHLLTGDRRDFGAFFGKTIQGVKIVSPQMLADELVKKGWLKKGTYNPPAKNATRTRSS